MRNMKIEINKQQPLDEVVAELERLGYTKSITYQGDSDSTIIATYNGGFSDWLFDTFKNHKLTTLAELKEQPNAAD